VYKGEH